MTNAKCPRPKEAPKAKPKKAVGKQVVRICPHLPAFVRGWGALVVMTKPL